MKPIVGARDPGNQEELFNVSEYSVIKSANQAAPYIGDWAEEYASVVLKANRLKLNSNNMCPDLLLDKNRFAEVKAVGPRYTFTIFKEGYEKQKALLASGSKLVFVLIHHEVIASDFVGKTLNDLREALCESVHHITIVPAYTVHKEVRKMLAEHGDWKFSPKRAEAYQRYVIIRRKFLETFMPKRMHRNKRALRSEVYGHPVGYVRCNVFSVPLKKSVHIGKWEKGIPEAADDLIFELERGWHDVALQPIKDGRKIRVVQGRNAEWYEHYLSEYPDAKRSEVIQTLKRIADGHLLKSKGPEERLLPYLDEMAGL